MSHIFNQVFYPKCQNASCAEENKYNNSDYFSHAFLISKHNFFPPASNTLSQVKHLSILVKLKIGSLESRGETNRHISIKYLK